MAQHLRTESEPQAAGARAEGGVQPLINAAEAAHRAARAHAGDLDRARREAAGAGRAGAVSAGLRAGRDGATPSAARDGRGRHAVTVLSVLIGCALAAAVLFVGGRALVAVLLDDGAADGAVAAGASAGEAGARDGVARFDAGEKIVDGSSTYLIIPDGDGYAFARRQGTEDAAVAALFEIPGTPVGFALHDGVLYIVSNSADGCLVQSYLYGDGSLPGDFYEGSGNVVDLALDGSDLVLTMADGRDYTLALPDAGA